MAPRILFVVMSAVAPVAAVDQLARSLRPHRVLVHHDFSQTPDFPLASDNVLFVPQPIRTGWATFGFVDGIFHSMRHALAHIDFDYLQLLSPTCLPIKPMAQFEAHVAGGQDAHFGAIDLLADDDCLMSVGYRAFTPADTLRHRVLRRLSTDWFARSQSRRDEAGVWLRSAGGRGLRTLPARWAVRAAAHPAVGRHPFGEQLRPYYGSVWFGARRQVVRGLVDGFDRPGMRDWFSRLRIAEEFLVPTLLMQHTRTRGPLNHYITKFDQAHPGRLDAYDLPTLQASPAFFARKFPDEAASPVRLRVLRELVGEPGADGATAPRPAAVRSVGEPADPPQRARAAEAAAPASTAAPLPATAPMAARQQLG